MGTQYVAEPTEQRRSRRAVTVSLRQLGPQAHDTRVAARKRDRAYAAVEALDRAHPEFTVPNAGRDVGHFLLILVILSACGLDLVLVGPAADHLARRSLGASPLVAEIVRFAFPVFLQVVELTIAHQVVVTKEEADETGERGPYRLWLLAAVVAACVMPAVVLVTHMASKPARLTEDQAAARNGLLFGMLAMMGVARAAMMFSGARGHEAKARLVFGVRRAWWSAWHGLHERKYAQSVAGTQDAYARYTAAREQHNATYPSSPISAGPFSKEVRDVLREHNGYEVIRLVDGPAADGSPGQTGGAPPAAAPAPAPVPAPPDTGDTPDDEVARDRRVREADSELAP